MCVDHAGAVPDIPPWLADSLRQLRPLVETGYENILLARLVMEQVGDQGMDKIGRGGRDGWTDDAISCARHVHMHCACCVCMHAVPASLRVGAQAECARAGGQVAGLPALGAPAPLRRHGAGLGGRE